MVKPIQENEYELWPYINDETPALSAIVPDISKWTNCPFSLTDVLLYIGKIHNIDGYIAVADSNGKIYWTVPKTKFRVVPNGRF